MEYTLTTPLDGLITEDWQDTMDECAEYDAAYTHIAVLRAIAVMGSSEHPNPLTGAQVSELLERIQQEGNRLLGREA